MIVNMLFIVTLNTSLMVVNWGNSGILQRKSICLVYTPKLPWTTLPIQVPIELQIELYIKLQIELQACELSFELSCELNLWHSKDLTNVTQVW